jgi:AAA family ATP:ADP antiporter
MTSDYPAKRLLGRLRERTDDARAYLAAPERRLGWLAGAAYFCALFAYYLLKTTREPLVLATGGAMLKSVSTGAQAMVLLVLLPIHAHLASRVGTRALVRRTGLAVLVGIAVFAVLSPFRPPGLGAAFYVFTGIVGVGAVAELGAFLADVVDPDHAKRVLPMALFGATFGSMAGSLLAGRLFALGLSVSWLLVVAAILFAAHLVFVERIGRAAAEGIGRRGFDDRPIAARDGFALVLASPSLRVFALLVIVANLINTNGELVLGERVTAAARATFEQLSARAGGAGLGIDEHAFLEREIGVFYGNFFLGVNVATVLLQLVFAGALARLGGARWLLLVPAVLSLGSYAIAGLGVALSVFHAVKTIENATDYSFGATGRALAWVDMSRDAKLVSKPVIDTFFVRIGDLFAAGLVAVGTALGMGATSFAWMNVGLGLGAILLVVGLTTRFAGDRVADPGARTTN